MTDNCKHHSTTAFMGRFIVSIYTSALELHCHTQVRAKRNANAPSPEDRRQESPPDKDTQQIEFQDNCNLGTAAAQIAPRVTVIRDRCNVHHQHPNCLATKTGCPAAAAPTSCELATGVT
eukprot:3488849-Amphidinium_carterae.2